MFVCEGVLACVCVRECKRECVCVCVCVVCVVCVCVCVCVRERKRTMGSNSFYQINHGCVSASFLKMCGGTLGKHMRTYC